MRDSSKENIRGVLLLVPLIVIALTLILLARPSERYSSNTPQESEPTMLLDSISGEDIATESRPQLRSFDPNEADYRTMLEAGVPRNIAVSLLKWREAGKVFRIKEDVALCYGMTDSLYFLLEPYINIGNEYRIVRDTVRTKRSTPADKPHTTIEPSRFSLDTVTANYLHAIGFSLREAELVIRYRDMIGGYRSIEEFEECYAVGAERAKWLEPYIVFPPRDSVATYSAERVTFPIDVNSADSAMLRRVRGIGEKSVMHILRYRELLGGYYSVEQISELKVVTPDNFRIISQQIWCDSARIKKICINFAGLKALEVHPYITNRMLRRIINHRELKGGWSTIEEMIESNIFTEEEAKRIAPYLDFGTNPE
ncbi:MAG: helix-hairpin-helix domain-containing protein [Alistipes sp.]|nr:helix-hairpin-helix domain-containing protein [Alistipes sp.]